MKRKSSKKYVVVLLIALLFFVSIGYAALSDTLRITGTANLKGVFDLKFESASIADTTSKSTATPNGKELVVVANLTYPGDGESITAVIKNESEVDAKVNGLRMTSTEFIKVTDNTWNGDNVTVVFPEMKDCVVPAGETCSVTFTVAWDADAQETYQTDSNPHSVGFSVEIDYVQNTTGNYVGTVEHQH